MSARGGRRTKDRKMARIKNISDKWGDPVEFEASTLDDAVFEQEDNRGQNNENRNVN